jgi:hypothetical protein
MPNAGIVKRAEAGAADAENGKAVAA